MRVLSLTIVVVLLVLVTTPRYVNANSTAGSSNFQLIGHDPLFDRGMNAALAVFHNFVYVGSRTDGSNRCGIGDPRRSASGIDSCPHTHPGILVVDVSDPTHPTVINEFGQEFTTGTNLGQTSRELRVWPQQQLLMVVYFRCSTIIHACVPSPNTWSIKFFDLSDAANPQLVSTYVPSFKPHEIFLWVDPNNDNRALLYISTPTISANPAIPNLIVTDISGARQGIFKEIAKGNWNNLYPGTDSPNYPFVRNALGQIIGCGSYDCNLFVHSMGVKPDGTRTYLAMEAGHFLVLDTSQVAAGVPNPSLILLTDPTNRPTWLQTPPDPSAVPQNCFKNCPNSHSAVQVLGRQLALTTDEVYGTFTDPSFGCQWGWARVIDVSDPSHPFITGQFQIAQNQPAFCGSPADSSTVEQFRSYSTHNPTVTRDLAFIAWHSGGLQVIDISQPTNPSHAGFFVPTPETFVATEDPGLSQGPATTVDQLFNPDVNNPDFQSKVVMWSYPIIAKGLVYVIDVRNGLFILQYTGPNQGEVQLLKFLEGNSNLGDAVTLDRQ